MGGASAVAALQIGLRGDNLSTTEMDAEFSARAGAIGVNPAGNAISNIPCQCSATRTGLIGAAHAANPSGDVLGPFFWHAAAQSWIGL